MRGEIDFAESFATRVALLEGLDASLLEQIAADLPLSEGAERLVSTVRKLGYKTAILSGGFTYFGHYLQQRLGIDYETLRSVKSDIIWAAISAMGPDYPDTPGYDPAIQAMVGFMELTGDPDGPPSLSGIPLIDLKAGDEVYANVCLALAEKRVWVVQHRMRHRSSPY